MQEVQNTKNTENNNKKQRRNLDSVAFRPRVIMTVKVTEIETVLTAVSNIESKFNFIKSYLFTSNFCQNFLLKLHIAFRVLITSKVFSSRLSRSAPDLLSQ